MSQARADARNLALTPHANMQAQHASTPAPLSVHRNITINLKPSPRHRMYSGTALAVRALIQYPSESCRPTNLSPPPTPAPPPGASSYAILVPSARTPCTLLVPSLYRSTSLTALSPRLSTPHELVCPIWLYEVSAFVHAQVRVFQCVFVSVGWMRGAQTPAGVCGFRLAVRAFGSTSRCYIEDTYFALITVITVRRSLRMTQGQSPCGWWPETTFLMLSNGLVCGARYSCASV